MLLLLLVLVLLCRSVLASERVCVSGALERDNSSSWSNPGEPGLLVEACSSLKALSLEFQAPHDSQPCGLSSPHGRMQGSKSSSPGAAVRQQQ